MRRMAARIREGSGTFTVRLYDGREFTLRPYTPDEHCYALQPAAGETISLPPFLLERCAVAPAISAIDLADMTGAELSELYEICLHESVFRRAARGFTEP
jgi:hypothetical protein